ncbi:hypothetical protein KM915_21140 [Cytobacillus oceanisediminis]|uniref:hypothetical protein n=1 Tax=Cytobacillus oceanisediminis TaxID=665099 RepID=UPI001C25129D|nr:hypothetical protein [Cytobacillus oceanisediminis]MBU8732558.1 hypothetical protein [Cytobacillus oceanisediminis]
MDFSLSIRKGNNLEELNLLLNKLSMNSKDQKEKIEYESIIKMFNELTVSMQEKYIGLLKGHMQKYDVLKDKK